MSQHRKGLLVAFTIVWSVRLCWRCEHCQLLFSCITELHCLYSTCRVADSCYFAFADNEDRGRHLCNSHTPGWLGACSLCLPSFNELSLSCAVRPYKGETDLTCWCMLHAVCCALSCDVQDSAYLLCPASCVHWRVYCSTSCMLCCQA